MALLYPNYMPIKINLSVAGKQFFQLLKSQRFKLFKSIDIFFNFFMESLEIQPTFQFLC